MIVALRATDSKPKPDSANCMGPIMTTFMRNCRVRSVFPIRKSVALESGDHLLVRGRAWNQIAGNLSMVNWSKGI